MGRMLKVVLLVSLAGMMGLARGQTEVSTLIRADITGSDVDCGQGGARCRICGDINAITSSCSSNAACVAFTFDGSCGFLKSASGPTAYREGYTTFVLANKGAAPPPAAAAATTPPASPAAATPAATLPVQVAAAPAATPEPAPAASPTPAPTPTPAASPAPAPTPAPVPAPVPSPSPSPAAAPVPTPAAAQPIQVSSSGSEVDNGQGAPVVQQGRTGFVGGGFPIGFGGIGFPGRRMLRVQQQQA